MEKHCVKKICSDFLKLDFCDKIMTINILPVVDSSITGLKLVKEEFDSDQIREQMANLSRDKTTVDCYHEITPVSKMS